MSPSTLSAPEHDVGVEHREQGLEPATAGRRGERVDDLALPRQIGVTNADDPDAEPTATGALRPGPDAIIAGPTFEEWLDARS